MVFNKQNKGFFLTLDDEAAPADLSIPSQATDSPEPTATPVVVTEPSEITPEPVLTPTAVTATRMVCVTIWKKIKVPTPTIHVILLWMLTATASVISRM